MPIIDTSYTSDYTGQQIDDTLDIIRQKENWDAFLKLQEYISQISQFANWIEELFDKCKYLDKIKEDNNSETKFINIKGDYLEGIKPQLVVDSMGGSLNDSNNKALIKFQNIGTQYTPIYSMPTKKGIFSSGMDYRQQENPFFRWEFTPTDGNYSNIIKDNNGDHYLAKLSMTGQLFGAVWNDYAEFRQTHETCAGRVVCECGDGTLERSTKRLQPGAEVVSDTFGFAIGETKECKTPIAVAGRVLAYPLENRNKFKPGDAVCSGPNGTVSKMTRREIRKYPERIIGTVSEIPTYEVWGDKEIPVNGRIWIKIK